MATPEYTMFSELFAYFTIFDQDWILPLAIAILITVLTTRKTSEWSAIFLPVWISLSLIGLRIEQAMYFLFLIIGLLMFVINGLSIQMIGKTFTLLTDYFKPFETLKNIRNKEQKQETEPLYSATYSLNLPNYLTDKIPLDINIKNQK